MQELHAVAVAGPAILAQWGTSDTPWGWHMWWGVWGVGMMLFMLLFWVVLIAGVVAVLRWLFGRPGSGGAGTRADRALEILKERYARGELTREQYHTMRRDLEA